jgi:capsular exopolysaccharide synthesis family protein
LILVLALVAGVALGAGAAVLSELFNRRIRDEEEAAMLYPLPVLARVPLIPRRLRRSPNGRTHLPSQVREAFRTLIVQITGEAEGRRVLMITSASSGDGKTSSAVNLAVSLAAAGHETILMDLDIRKPDIARFLGLSATVPLADLISSKKKLGQLLSDAPGVPSLRVLATGEGSSGDLVEALSHRMPQLIGQARELAEFVVIDTAPVGEVSDALRIMSEVDAVVAVTRPGNTDRGDYDVMRDLLERTSNDPSGLLVIGNAPGMLRNHYGYGYGDARQRRGSRAAGSSRR